MINVIKTHHLQLITKESWRELALEAESIVLQKINEKATKTTEYFFNEIVGTRNHQQAKKMTEKGQKESVKHTRVQVSFNLIEIDKFLAKFDSHSFLAYVFL